VRRPSSAAAFAAALAVGIALRAAMVVSIRVFPIVANTWDSTWYHQVAASLAAGHGFQFLGKPSAFYPPCFPLVLAAGYVPFGADPRIGQWVNFMVSLWLVAAAAFAARELFGPAAGKRTAVLLALEPNHIVLPAFLMSEVLCAAGVMTFLGAWLRYRRGGGAGWLAAATLAAAAAGMTRGHAFLLAPVVVLFAGVLPRATRRRGLIGGVVVGAACAAVLAGWAARNESRLGHPVTIATNGGINLLLGNNPNAWGGRADPPGDVPQTGDEVRDEEIATHRALEYIKGDPLRYAAILPLKVARLWGFGPGVTYRYEIATKMGELWGKLIPALCQLAHLAVLLLAFRGLWISRRILANRDAGKLIAWLLAVWTLGHLPFLGGARYLFPVYGLLAAAAVGIPGPAGEPEVSSAA